MITFAIRTRRCGDRSYGFSFFVFDTVTLVQTVFFIYLFYLFLPGRFQLSTAARFRN